MTGAPALAQTASCPYPEAFDEATGYLGTATTVAGAMLETGASCASFEAGCQAIKDNAYQANYYVGAYFDYNYDWVHDCRKCEPLYDDLEPMIDSLIMLDGFVQSAGWRNASYGTVVVQIMGAWDKPVCGTGADADAADGADSASASAAAAALDNEDAELVEPFMGENHPCRQLWYGARKAEAVWKWAGPGGSTQSSEVDGLLCNYYGPTFYAFDGKNFRSYQCDDGYVTCTPTEDFRATLVEHTRDGEGTNTITYETPDGQRGLVYRTQQ